MELREIQRIEDEDAKHYFPDVEQGFLYFGNALAGEVGEICNMIKKWARGSITTNEMNEVIREEAPDVLIYLVMLCAHAERDLQDDYDVKKAYNERRYRG